MNTNTALALKDSMMEKEADIIKKRKKAKELKDKGNAEFEQKKYAEAEKCYTEALDLNIGSRPLWTNRAACRNTMEKYEEAISDCDTALSIDAKCTRSIIQKGNALLGLRQFDAAKECYESLRSLGENSSADFHLKKLHDIQEGDEFKKNIQKISINSHHTKLPYPHLTSQEYIYHAHKTSNIESSNLIGFLTLPLPTGSTEPITPQYAFRENKRLYICKMFPETPSEI